MFAVTCRYCHAVVVTAPQIRAPEEEELADHLKRVHRIVDSRTSPVGRLLDHFVIQPSQGAGRD